MESLCSRASIGGTTAHMTTSDHGAVVKVIELVGSSERSFSDAVRHAVKVASKSIRNITAVDVLSSSAEVDRFGEIAAYKVTCRLSFVIDRGRVDVGDDLDDDTPSERELVAGGAITETDLAFGGRLPDAPS
jgi:dodecin